MQPSELTLTGSVPQRALIGSRAELHEAVQVALEVARRSVCCLHRDLSLFDLGSVWAEGHLHRLLMSHRSARVRLLVDDAAWLDSRTPRLRSLQRVFSHALEIRLASPDDPVGDDAYLLADDHVAVQLKPTAAVRGDIWVNNKPHLQPLLAAFDRRWECGGHNLAVVPLGLG